MFIYKPDVLVIADPAVFAPVAIITKETRSVVDVVKLPVYLKKNLLSVEFVIYLFEFGIKESNIVPLNDVLANMLLKFFTKYIP